MTGDRELLTVPNDHPLYPWHHRPADHNVAGLFVDGPQLAQDALAMFRTFTRCREQAPTPTVAHAQARLKVIRAKRSAAGMRKLLAALRVMPVRHGRAA